MPIEARELDFARQQAEELLKGNADPNASNYGDIIHHCNETLGRIALREGKLEVAKAYLLKAGQTPGSPMLNIWDLLLTWLANCSRRISATS